MTTWEYFAPFIAASPLLLLLLGVALVALWKAIHGLR